MKGMEDIMNIQNRNKDLTQIFDSRWKANHDYDAVKKMKQHDRDFTNKCLMLEKVMQAIITKLIIWKKD